MFHFIFDYNYGSLWQILVIVLPQETEMNTPPDVVIVLPQETEMNTPPEIAISQKLFNRFGQNFQGYEW